MGGMHPSASPGIDGIPVEFYKVFWLDIKDIFVKTIKKPLLMVNYAFHNEEGFSVFYLKKIKIRCY